MVLGRAIGVVCCLARNHGACVCPGGLDGAGPPRNKKKGAGVVSGGHHPKNKFVCKNGYSNAYQAIPPQARPPTHINLQQTTSKHAYQEVVVKSGLARTHTLFIMLDIVRKLFLSFGKLL